MFWKDQSGVSALVFALALPALVAGVGGSIEISRVTAFKQRLVSATELACRHAALNIDAARQEEDKKGKKKDKNKDYTYVLNDAIEKNFPAKGFATTNVTNKSITAANVQISSNGTIPLIFGTVLKVPDMTFSLVRDCAITEHENNEDVLIFSESFEFGHSVPPNSWTVLKNWNGWKTQDAGVEINGQRELSGNTIRFGDFFAELDSHCYVSGCHSNSTMSYEKTLVAGTYEVSYWYISRIRFSAHNNQLICSTDAETTGNARHDKVAWAKDSTDNETNRIELYVEREKNNQFDAVMKRENMVDVCVYADKWTERKINFTVPSEAKYRISWKAAGKEDTVGGLIDYLRVCKNDCP